MHKVFLPYSESGKDILEITRNFQYFTKNYLHNMNNQIFIENSKEPSNKYLNIIGVKQITDSLNRHGKGIINSIFNKAFGYISKQIKILLEIFFDDNIFSLIENENSFLEENEETIKFNYPLNRGKNLLKKILNLNLNKNYIAKSIQCITEIGNCVALVRCIRTAVMNYNSQNLGLLTSYNIKDNLIHQISLQIELDLINKNSHISQNMLVNIQNSFIYLNQIFCETINSLKHNKVNELNYLRILVEPFERSFEKLPKIDLFVFLLPPLTLTFIDKAIESRKNIEKNKIIGDNSCFSDDGFMMGICFLLKIFKADKKFENLSWFSSAIEDYKRQQNKLKSSKISQSGQILDIIQINDYIEQFEMQNFIYTSASFLFTELDKLYKLGHFTLNELYKNNKSKRLESNELDKNSKLINSTLNKLNKYLNI